MRKNEVLSMPHLQQASSMRLVHKHAWTHTSLCVTRGPTRGAPIFLQTPRLHAVFCNPSPEKKKSREARPNLKTLDPWGHMGKKMTWELKLSSPETGPEF